MENEERAHKRYEKRKELGEERKRKELEEKRKR